MPSFRAGEIALYAQDLTSTFRAPSPGGRSVAVDPLIIYARLDSAEAEHVVRRRRDPDEFDAHHAADYPLGGLTPALAGARGGRHERLGSALDGRTGTATVKGSQYCQKAARWSTGI